MAKGLQRSLGRADAIERGIIKKRLQVGATITVDGATGVGFGSVVLTDFPEGHIMLHGARCDLTFTEASASMADDFAGDFAIGTTPASDGTLSVGDVDIIASTATQTAAAGVSAANVANNVVAAAFDNSDGSLEVNLSMLVDDADISADGVSVAVTGYATLLYSVMGDD